MTTTHKITVSDTEKFAIAYVAANRVAQHYDPTKPGFRCAYEIAADLDCERGTLEWDAAVAGAASYYINGHRF